MLVLRSVVRAAVSQIRTRAVRDPWPPVLGTNASLSSRSVAAVLSSFRRSCCADAKPALHSSNAGGTGKTDGAVSRFHKLGLHPGVVEALTAQGVVTPTAIQEKAIPAALRGANVLIAAETGSGKTLAYLAPLVTLLKKTELPIRRRPSRPRAIVLVPTRELVTQVLGVAKLLSHSAKFSSRPAVGGPHKRSLKKSFMDEPVDVLIATPGMLAHMREQKLVLLSDLDFVVIDEADVTLASQGFHEQVQPLLKAVDAKPHLDPPQKKAQFLYAAATVPASVRRLLHMRHPDDNGLFTAETNQLHRATPPERVHVKFLRVSGGEDAKLKRAVELVVESLRRRSDGKVMLFCDRDNRRTKIVDMLQDSHHISVVHMSREVDRLDRYSDWKLFCSNPEVRVAVCAQSFSRGIDHAGIQSVIMTDVPMTGNEYLHRIGRIRGHGNVVVLVSNRDRAVAEALFLAHVNGADMSQLNAPGAWRSFIDAGCDRIATDLSVARARKSGSAVWADERPSAVGTIRDGQSGRRGQVRRRTILRTAVRRPGREDKGVADNRRCRSHGDGYRENDMYRGEARGSRRDEKGVDDNRRRPTSGDRYREKYMQRSEDRGSRRDDSRVEDNRHSRSLGDGYRAKYMHRGEDRGSRRDDMYHPKSSTSFRTRGTGSSRVGTGFRPLSPTSGRDASRATRYEKRRYADSGPYSGGSWTPLERG